MKQKRDNNSTAGAKEKDYYFSDFCLFRIQETIWQDMRTWRSPWEQWLRWESWQWSSRWWFRWQETSLATYLPSLQHCKNPLTSQLESVCVSFLGAHRVSCFSYSIIVIGEGGWLENEKRGKVYFSQIPSSVAPLPAPCPCSQRSPPPPCCTSRHNPSPPHARSGIICMSAITDSFMYLKGEVRQFFCWLKVLSAPN